jgi:hypothetical protein
VYGCYDDHRLATEVDDLEDTMEEIEWETESGEPSRETGTRCLEPNEAYKERLAELHKRRLLEQAVVTGPVTGADVTHGYHC